MPYSTRSFTTIKSQVLADITSAPFVTNGLLQKAVLRYLGYAISKESFYHDEHIRWIAKQCVPWTATDNWLTAWASLKGITRAPAKPSSGVIGVGVLVANSIISANTIVTNQSGIGYSNANGVTIATTGVYSLPMTSTTGGSDTNMDVGVTVSFTSPITGVNTVATTTVAFTGGTDQELDDSLRNRMIESFRSVGQSGSTTNYVDWADNTGIVTRVWVLPSVNGPGSVGVWFMNDTNTNNGFPVGTDGVATNEFRWPQKATGEQLEVANILSDPSTKPATHVVYVMSPVASNVAVSIQGLSNDSPTVRTNIAAALAQLCIDCGNPLNTSSVPTLYPSQINTAIQGAAGATATFTLLAPSSPVSLPLGYLPVIANSNITYS